MRLADLSPAQDQTRGPRAIAHFRRLARFLIAGGSNMHGTSNHPKRAKPVAGPVAGLGARRSASDPRAQRLARLEKALQGPLERPEPLLQTLLSELERGTHRRELWERLHAAADREGKEIELAAAYEKFTVERRLRLLPRADRVVVLMHAADFFQGVVGDAESAERLLWRALEVMPDNEEALARLERRCVASKSRVRRVQLYALVAHDPPRPASVIAKAALDIISVLPSKSVVPDDACRKLLALQPANASLLGVLEKHCCLTGRWSLACEILERSLEIAPGAEREASGRRSRLVSMYLGAAGTPDLAMPHVEALLQRDPCNESARSAAEQLLRVPKVSSRAAAALHAARQRVRLGT